MMSHRVRDIFSYFMFLLLEDEKPFVRPETLILYYRETPDKLAII